MTRTIFLVGAVALALGAFALWRMARVPTAMVEVATREAVEGDPELGRTLLARYGCDACHTIPGVRSARGEVGPPLGTVAARSYVAGALATTPANLGRWIRDPQDVEPGTAMPDLDVNEEDARHMVAYLYAISGGGER